MHDVDEASLAVRRLKSCYYDRIPLVLDFCEQSYLMEIPYDYFFDDNDDEFYCAELIEKAFQAAGLRLSEPVPVRYLPNYPQYRKLVFFLACLSPISSDNPVYAPGNTHYGTLSSPFLEAVYQTPEVTAFLQTCKPPLDWQGPGRAELRKQPGDDSR